MIETKGLTDTQQRRAHSHVSIVMDLSLREFYDLALGMAGVGSIYDDNGVGVDATHIASADAQEIRSLRSEVSTLRAELERSQKVSAQMTEAAERALADLAEAKKTDFRAKDLAALAKERGDEISRLNRIAKEYRARHEQQVDALLCELKAEKDKVSDLIDQIRSLSGDNSKTIDAAKVIPPKSGQSGKDTSANNAVSPIVEKLPPKRIAVISGKCVQSRSGQTLVSSTTVAKCVGALGFGEARTLSAISEMFGYASGAKVKSDLEKNAQALASIGLSFEFSGDLVRMRWSS